MVADHTPELARSALSCTIAPVRPDIVILAAGVGARYGGLKQMEGVGPGGAALLEYTLYDAARAGFGRVVFVIRPEMQVEFHDRIGRRLERRVTVAYAHQRLDALPPGFAVPPGRGKPWGTAHAVLACADVIDGPFAVANADDYYGPGALHRVAQPPSHAAEGVAQPPSAVTPASTYALVAYRLRDTLSEAGAVSRGVCRVGPDGWLQGIEETTGIEKHNSGGRYRDAAGVVRTLPGDTPVSMNLWAFQPDFFTHLRAAFAAFLRTHGGSTAAELYLPAVVNELIASGRARVRVLPAEDAWFGITHRADRPRVEAMIRERIARGDYPQELWVER